MLYYRSVLAGLSVALFFMFSGGASAQMPGCDSAKPLLESRQKIIGEISSWGSKNKKVAPDRACSVGKQLVSNGDALLKWMEENQAWCGIPSEFIENIKRDHKQAVTLRANACKTAEQVQKQQNQSVMGEKNPLGSGGLSGQWKIPQGAL